MKKVLVLGASGMLGHRLFLDLQGQFDTYGTLRSPCSELKAFDAPSDKIIVGVDALNLQSLRNVFEKVKPNYVINAIGGIKQHKDMSPAEMIEVNSVLPWRLFELSKFFEARLIQISTDCVFDGVKGKYTDKDQPNATDVYGRSKFLGEIGDRDNVLTLRTSIIGREIKNGLSLVEWFLSQAEGQKLKGFRCAIYTGFPTHTMSKLLATVITEDKFLCGLYNISSEPINKYDLLVKLAKRLEKNVELLPVDEPKIDRSLVSKEIWEKVPFKISRNWDHLIEDLMIDFEKYEKLESLR